MYGCDVGGEGVLIFELVDCFILCFFVWGCECVVLIFSEVEVVWLRRRYEDASAVLV